jgi:hypothetical protein
MSLTDEQIETIYKEQTGAFIDDSPWALHDFSRAIESAATAPLLERIAELEANEKVLLAQVQGHTEWRERIIKASEQAYGESAIRYKFSLTKSGKCMNTFPREIDGRWFALVPAEDDGHIGHIARIAELEKERDEWKDDAINGGNAQYLRERVAELERHNKALVDRRQHDVADIKDGVKKLDALERELEAVRKDSERYRWLRVMAARM